uniref:Uncharacterized protein SEC0013 n=1 Tax=Synechococcus elongatus (strain ATCC 33912 / PCC 7942 / FACHB-805) TaxID=1140 RepID=Q8KPU5_SYNE7|nr:unknown [Synechococcus elongatus PCC 7942 = FACHB-805]
MWLRTLLGSHGISHSLESNWIKCSSFLTENQSALALIKWRSLIASDLNNSPGLRINYLGQQRE